MPISFATCTNAASLSDLPFDVDWFVRLVARCTEYKIAHVWDGPSPFTSPVSLKQAVAVLRSLWAWELSRMHGVAMSSPEAMQQLHMRKQSWKERLRGWAFVVRRQGALDSLRHGLHWLRLLRCASPRYCVYAAGLGAVSSLQFADSAGSRQQPALTSSEPGQLTTGSWQPANILRWLPFPNPLSRTATEREGRGRSSSLELSGVPGGNARMSTSPSPLSPGSGRAAVLCAMHWSH